VNEIINGKHSKARYYDKEGNAVYEVMGKTTGKLRSVTINDVRQNGWLPSVTTIIAECNNKDYLLNWKLNMLAEIMMQHLINPAEPFDEYRLWINNELERQSSEASRQGSLIHDAIADYLTDKKTEHLPVKLKTWIDENIAEIEAVEGSRVCKLFAGRIDFVGKLKTGRRVIIDWKTQKFDKYPKWYDDYKWQLIAYRKMVDYYDNIQLLNVFYSTMVDIDPVVKILEGKEAIETEETWNAMLNYYRLKQGLI
jgi:hypothetical protein